MAFLVDKKAICTKVNIRNQDIALWELSPKSFYTECLHTQLEERTHQIPEHNYTIQIAALNLRLMKRPTHTYSNLTLF